MSIKGFLESDVAARCGVSAQFFRCLVDKGMLPQPDISIRARQGYSEKIASECHQRFLKLGGLLRVGQLAKESGTDHGYVSKLIADKRIPSPDLHLSASRFYLGSRRKKLIAEITKCKAQDKKQRKNMSSLVAVENANKRYARRRAAGFFSSRDVADMAGVSCMTVAHHQGTKAISKPTHEVKGCFGYYYTKDEADEILKFLKTKGKGALV